MSLPAHMSMSGLLRFARGAVLLAVAGLLAAGDAAPSGPDLTGAWRAVCSVSGDLWFGRIELRKAGAGWSGPAFWWRCIPEGEALAMARGGRATTTTSYSAAGAEQLAARLDGGKVVLAGSQPMKLLGVGYGTTTATCAIEDGCLHASAKASGKGGEHTVQYFLIREELWTAPGPLALPIGKSTHVACLGGQWHYTVYVPSGYDHAKPAPVFIRHSPGGGAKPYLPKLLDELGIIGVGLTESKNGPWEPIGQNRNAALIDLRRRLAIDWTKVFFGGESGGARSSSWSGLSTPGMTAGLLQIIAAWGDLPAKVPRDVPIFFITGKTDYNKDEVEGAYRAELKAGRRTELVVHDGGHTTGPEANVEKGIRWLAQQAGLGKK